MELCDINQIRALLNRHGFRFSKSMGQNFLIAPWVPEEIAASAELDETMGVLEVGPGIGCLTASLAKYAGKVVSVELDNALRPVLAETLEGLENAEVVFGDVLKLDLQSFVKEHFAGLRPAVCANLPYNITSPVLSAFLESGCFESITVMIQKEVARRICAGANTADYGAFTVFVNWYAETELLFDVSPDCFMPQPKVTSTVIRLKQRKTPPAEVCDEKLFFRVVKAAFAQRRKTLNNALGAGFGELTKEQLAKVISTCGFDERIRGEVLDIEGFAAITNAIDKLLP